MCSLPVRIAVIIEVSCMGVDRRGQMTPCEVTAMPFVLGAGRHLRAVDPRGS
jgi:hypothetical protein